VEGEGYKVKLIVKAPIFPKDIKDLIYYLTDLVLRQKANEKIEQIAKTVEIIEQRLRAEAKYHPVEVLKSLRLVAQEIRKFKL